MTQHEHPSEQQEHLELDTEPETGRDPPSWQTEDPDRTRETDEAAPAEYAVSAEQAAMHLEGEEGGGRVWR
ncbi:MAG: hypothetical protein ACRDQW_15950 [Haloechinothrix sp.]